MGQDARLKLLEPNSMNLDSQLGLETMCLPFSAGLPTFYHAFQLEPERTTGPSGTTNEGHLKGVC